MLLIIFIDKVLYNTIKLVAINDNSITTLCLIISYLNSFLYLNIFSKNFNELYISANIINSFIIKGTIYTNIEKDIPYPGPVEKTNDDIVMPNDTAFIKLNTTINGIPIIEKLNIQRINNSKKSCLAYPPIACEGLLSIIVILSFTYEEIS